MYNKVATKLKGEIASLYFFDFLHVNSPLLPFTHLLTTHFASAKLHTLLLRLLLPEFNKFLLRKIV